MRETVDRSVLMPNIIRRFAEIEPDRPFLTEVTGRTATYGEVHELALRWAAGFRRLGLGPHVHVMTMSPPRIDWLAAWMGLAMIKAVDAGVSTDFHGEMLRYVVHKSAATAIVVAPEYLDRLTAGIVDGSDLRTIVVAGKLDDREPPPGVTLIGIEDFLAERADPATIEPTEFRDTGAMILTSGTTGPSKYVLTPWGTHYSGARAMVPPEDARPDDVSYQPLPIYHLAARFSIYSMVLVGGQVVFRDHLSIRDFWPDIARHRCTVTNLSPFARLLMVAEPGPHDADNTLRTVMLAPRGDPKPLAERFGVNVCTGFGMSETGVPVVAPFDAPAQTAGKPLAGWPGYEMRVVNECDEEVPVGEVGELIVRAAEPWVLFQGYFGDPEATARAWRNGWFHTGDGFRTDADGWLYFVDRIKDSLRRRNQNISSFEVEILVNTCPNVKESAAVGLQTEGEEDELLVVIVPMEPESPPAPEALYDYFAETLPRFMLPRYIRFVDELPKTAASGRTKKVELRTTGITDDTWDRETSRLSGAR